MPTYPQTVVANCPAYPPTNTYNLPHYTAAEAMQQGIASVYSNMLARTRALITGEVMIEPCLLATVITNNRVEGRAVEPVYGNMHPSFALWLPQQRPGRADSLFVELYRIDPKNLTQTEEYHYKLDADGNGISELTIHPFELAGGKLHFHDTSSTRSGQLTIKDLLILDMMYGSISTSLRVPPEADELVPTKTPLRRYIGRRLSRTIFTPPEE